MVRNDAIPRAKAVQNHSVWNAGISVLRLALTITEQMYAKTRTLRFVSPSDVPNRPSRLSECELSGLVYKMLRSIVLPRPGTDSVNPAVSFGEKPCMMATNKPYGDGQRKGAVKERSQVLNPKTGRYVKKRCGNRKVHGCEAGRHSVQRRSQRSNGPDRPDGGRSYIESSDFLSNGRRRQTPPSARCG